MKYLIFIALLVFSYAAAAQPFNQTDKDGKKTGKWKQVYGNGKVRYTGEFKADIPIGTFKYYDSDGRLKTEIMHKGDGHHSTCVMYSNEKISAKGFYYDQKKDSLWVYYNDNTGQQIKEERYKRGMKHGTWKVYYFSGGVYSIANYRNDTLHGVWKEYLEDGMPRLTAQYSFGQLTGNYFQFNSQGDTITAGKYVAGKRDGVWRHYEENNTISRKEFIRMGWVYKEEIYKNGILSETRRKGVNRSEN